MREVSLRRKVLFIGFSGLGVLSIWFFMAIPEFEKLPSDYVLLMEFHGIDQIAERPLGELSEPFGLNEMLEQKVSKVDGNVAIIESRVFGEKSDSGEIVFDLTHSFTVDRNSLEHLDQDGQLFGFRPGVEKIEYDFFHPLVFENSKMVFDRTENIYGLEVYVFKSEVINDDVTQAFPQFSPYKIKSDTTSIFWVEPITGELIRFEKNWVDYIEDGVDIIPVQIGSKSSTEFSDFILSEKAKAHIGFITFANILVPLVIAGVFVTAASVMILQTKLYKAKKEINRQEKLATIGQLSAKVAHDLRNPLSVIMNVNTLDKMRPAKTEKEIEKRKEMVARAVERMAHQINRVMDFVKTKPLQLENAPVKTIIDSAKHTMLIPDDVEIIFEGENIELNCDVRVMEALFSNLFTNAIQAMDEKGKITIRAENKKNYCVIKIIDEGPGVPKELKEKIFEPLFTTKQQGTGLGLASCRNMVEQHGGTITVDNNPTTFTIKVPKTVKLLQEENYV